ncbi:MAG: GntR family transcriptional regulator, partial [Actinobacteria bacterium]|nr:GntR family transcriptional regulator [Actinomycetota bacterium]
MTASAQRPAPVATPPPAVQRSRLYEQVMQWLAVHMSSAGMGPGDRLPPERQLAASLGVSRASLRQAMAALEVQGVVEVRHGDGTYLRVPPQRRDSIDQLLARPRKLPEILEARAALEVELARLAAIRRTQEDLTAIDEALEQMRAEVESGGSGADGDALFHSAVSAAAHNSVMRELMAYLAQPIEETRAASLSAEDR